MKPLELKKLVLIGIMAEIDIVISIFSEQFASQIVKLEMGSAWL